jgi:hypothetical protein
MGVKREEQRYTPDDAAAESQASEMTNKRLVLLGRSHGARSARLDTQKRQTK